MKKITRFKLESILIIWIPILIAIFFWNKIPNRLPTHFNSQMVADSWSSKTVALILLPIILTIVQLFLIIVISKDPKNKNIQSWIQKLVFSIMPVLSVIIFSLTILNGTHSSFSSKSQGNYLSMVLGIIFIILGIILGKIQSNHTIGIRTPWTLHSEENWNKTHKFGKKVYIIGGMAMIIASFIPIKIIFISILVLTVLVPFIYSYLLYKKGI